MGVVLCGIFHLLVSHCFSLLVTRLRSESNKIAIANAGGIQIVLSSMRNRPHHEPIQQYGCRVLSNLSYNGTQKVFLHFIMTSIDDTESLISSYNGIELVLQAMKNHPTAKYVQQNACNFLLNMSTKGSVDVSADSVLSWLFREQQTCND